MRLLKVVSVFVLLLLFTSKIVSDARIFAFSNAIESVAAEAGETEETEPRLNELFISISVLMVIAPFFLLLGEKQVPLKHQSWISFYPPIQTPPPNRLF
ncbi:hypothetical protein C7T94_05830 [Pedobacter yulinensis]|uniref:Uncharacterized protein n=1 Tax=Pedobacter yulinensis TaxID=2126353 RepID=A0A2T3HP56_9SPHI|nr:hypothetical protein [Pedobacter yulinensis]PST84240.1 hypothetical protein C7T94_05830 [Pedobacter yulinensis]